MEKRKANILFNKTGQGSRTTRITLPVSWVDKIGATEESREVFIYQVAGEIIITKEEWKMSNEKVLEIVLTEIKKDICKNFIDNSDGTSYIFDLIYNTIEILVDEDEVEDTYEDIHMNIYDEVVNFLNNNYKCLSKIDSNGDATVFYYDNCFDFEDVEALEKHFLIGE